MSDQQPHKWIWFCAVLLAALLLAPYFGLRIFREGPDRSIRTTLEKSGASTTKLESPREARSGSEFRSTGSASKEDKQAEHTLSEVEELLK